MKCAAGRSAYIFALLITWRLQLTILLPATNAPLALENWINDLLFSIFISDENVREYVAEYGDVVSRLISDEYVSEYGQMRVTSHMDEYVDEYVDEYGIMRVRPKPI